MIPNIFKVTAVFRLINLTERLSDSLKFYEIILDIKWYAQQEVILI